MNCAPEQAARHRQLHGWCDGIPAVIDADTVGEPPQVTTEIVVCGGTVPADVCAPIGRCGLGVVDATPQGEAVVVTVR